MQAAPRSFSLSRVISGWWWLLNRDGLRLIQFAAFWVLVKFGLYALDYALGLNQGLGLLSTTLLLDPFFYGVFYLVALSDDGSGPMQVRGEASRRFLALLGLAVMSGAGIIIGMFFLIIPGIALAVLWSVATPVLLAENKGPVEALQTSFSYVKTHFWPVFGAIFIYVVGVIAISIFFVFMGVESETGAPGPILAIDSLIEVVFAIIEVYLYTAIYRELAFRDQNVADVFD